MTKIAIYEKFGKQVYIWWKILKELSSLWSKVRNNLFSLISQSKHILLVLKRTVSNRRFFWAPTLYIKIDEWENNNIHGVVKKFSALYASVRFIELKSLSVGHMIKLKDIGSVKSMRWCLVAYVKHFQERRVRHNCQIEKLEIRAVTKYFSKKGMPPKEFMKTSLKSWRKSLRLIAQWKNGQQSLRGREREHWGWWTVWLPQRYNCW